MTNGAKFLCHDYRSSFLSEILCNYIMELLALRVVRNPSLTYMFFLLRRAFRANDMRLSTLRDGKFSEAVL